MADSKSESWRLPRGHESRDHLQLTFWSDQRKQDLDAGTTEKRLGRYDDDAEARLWRSLLGARRGIVDESEMDDGGISGEERAV